MPKSLVIPLEDELYRRFTKLCQHDWICLKDIAYEWIKEDVESYEEYLKEQEEEERQKHEPPKLKGIRIL